MIYNTVIQPIYKANEENVDSVLNTAISSANLSALKKAVKSATSSKNVVANAAVSDDE